MARVTVEDCLSHVNNRFDLVLLASKRARQLANRRAEPLLAGGNHKPTVQALREVAAGLVSRNVVEQDNDEVDMKLTRERALAKEPVIERNLDD